MSDINKIMSTKGTYYGYRIGQTIMWDGEKFRIKGWWKPGRVVLSPGNHIVYRKGIKKIK